MAKNYIFFLIILFFSFEAKAKLTIFACEPEWGSLAREITQNKADILVATRASQDPYLFPKKTPEMVDMIVKSDLVICSGGNLEQNWLPDLLKFSANEKVHSGKNVIMAFDYVNRLPFQTERNLARVHLNPHNIPPIAIQLLNRLKETDPLNANFYQNSYDSFIKQWNSAIKVWELQIMPLRGKKVVILDDSWLYMIDWMKLSISTKVANKIGSQPNSFEIEAIEKSLKNNLPDMIIFADFEQKDALFRISNDLHIRAVFLPFTVGGLVNTNNLFDLFNFTINRLLVDCSKTACQSFDASQLGRYINYGDTRATQTY